MRSCSPQRRRRGNWIGRIQTLGTEAATINSVRGAEVDSQIRNNRRLIIDDNEWAGILFDRVKESVPPEIHEMSLAGVNERLRCYEYEVGHRFAPHSDGFLSAVKLNEAVIPTWSI